MIHLLLIIVQFSNMEHRKQRPPCRKIFRRKKSLQTLDATHSS
jgi:hypothetical protein